MGENQYVYLADSFLKGNLSLIQLPPTLIDFAYFRGQYYWPGGVLPAIFLMPFVAIFGTDFQEGFIKLPLTILNFWLVFKICRLRNLSPIKSLWLALFFIFGSVYIPVAAIPWSVYLAQVSTTFGLLMAIYLFITKKNYWLIGASLALAILSRPTTVIGSLFFLLPIVQNPTPLKNLAKFALPIAASLILLATYNFLRFGNFWEAGYTYQLSSQEFINRKSAGLFSLKMIPTNLYYMLIKTPDPILEESSHVLKFPFLKFDPYGMSIFLMSPVLLLIFKANFKNQLVKTSLITSTAMLLPILTYAGIGYVQIGYRYALDLLPFLLIVLISAVKNTSQSIVILLVTLGIILYWFFIFEKLAGF